jgi:hypothetical protein
MVELYIRSTLRLYDVVRNLLSTGDLPFTVLGISNLVVCAAYPVHVSRINLTTIAWLRKDF